ncbi:unnamed protein product, partial [Brassica rapa subsp. trilocularis]
RSSVAFCPNVTCSSGGLCCKVELAPAVAAGYGVLLLGGGLLALYCFYTILLLLMLYLSRPYERRRLPIKNLREKEV